MFLMYSKLWQRPAILLFLIFALWNILKVKPHAARLFALLRKVGFSDKQSRYIVAQAAHETGDFKSRIYLEANNPFGMKRAYIRPRDQAGEKFGHAAYNNIEQAVWDYRLYYNYSNLSPEYFTLGDYVNALKRKFYFEDSESNYLRGAQFFYNKYFTA